MPALIIKMQSYRDYKDNLITKEDVLEGKTFYETKRGEEILRSFNAFKIGDLSQSRDWNREEE